MKYRIGLPRQNKQQTHLLYCRGTKRQRAVNRSVRFGAAARHDHGLSHALLLLGKAALFTDPTSLHRSLLTPQRLQSCRDATLLSPVINSSHNRSVGSAAAQATSHRKVHQHRHTWGSSDSGLVLDKSVHPSKVHINIHSSTSA